MGLFDAVIKFRTSGGNGEEVGDDVGRPIMEELRFNHRRAC